jgi:hypothetical protein
MIAGVSVLRTRNIGDYVSSPFRYFDLGPHRQMVDLAEDPDAGVSAVIYGGGGIGLRLLRHPGWRQRAPVSIAWGVGTSDARDMNVIKRPPAPWLTLFGSREWGQPGAVWVPCASCMSPLFDQLRPAPAHEAVLYFNRDRALANPDQALVIDGLPCGDNWMPFDEALAHLASGATVVTDSYHGAYWAALLGRKAVLVAPYSSKFHGFRHPPAIAADPQSWQQAAKGAQSYADALAVSRQANLDFYWRVMELIKQ